MDDLADGLAQPLGVAGLVESLGAAGLHEIEEVGRPRQAAGVGGEDSVGAVFHDHFNPSVT